VAALRNVVKACGPSLPDRLRAIKLNLSGDAFTMSDSICAYLASVAVVLSAPGRSPAAADLDARAAQPHQGARGRSPP
jgi:hypothetical protein